MPSSTKRGERKLSEIARHVVAPSGIVSTGWPAVETKCRELGIRFRPWQPNVGRLILAKRADQKYAATIGGTGLSIPRQVGKTFLVGAIVFALCLLLPDLTVIWTSHRLRTAEETFGKMQAFAMRKRIAPHILKIILGAGEQTIAFRNGSRILFGARERGFGRGFDEVDVLIFDEAQILSESAMDDMIPAGNQSRQATAVLLLFMGTPPKPSDPSDVFTRMRTDALSGEDSDTGWVEFGADPGYVPTSPPAELTETDWKQVAKANPSYPEDTPRESILRMRKNLGPDSFLREGLGIWDEIAVNDSDLDLSGWDALEDDEAAAESIAAFAVEVSIDRAWAAVAAAGPALDGRMHLEIVDHERGTAWVVARCVALNEAHGPATFVVDSGSPAASLIPELEAAGLLVYATDTNEVATAAANLVDGIPERLYVHGPQAEIKTAIACVRKRSLGDGKFAFGRKKSGGDISPLVAITLAAWFALQKLAYAHVMFVEPDPTADGAQRTREGVRILSQDETTTLRYPGPS